MNGIAIFQLYSLDGSASYVNAMQTTNPYTNGRGELQLHIEKLFLAKAGVTYKIRAFQAVSDAAAHTLAMYVVSNVSWTAL